MKCCAGDSVLKEAIDLTRAVLGVPEDYRIGIVPGSDTGAVEMALWSLLGARGVDVLAWESFGLGWVTDVVKQLKLAEDLAELGAKQGKLGGMQGRLGAKQGKRVRNRGGDLAIVLAVKRQVICGHHCHQSAFS